MMINKIEKKIQFLSYNFSPYTNVVGLSRSIIALGTLLTLLFSSTDTLLHKVGDEYLNPLLNPIAPINKFNFFVILGLENFLISKIIAILILSIIISGYYIKITSILHWWITISFFLFSSVIDGGDQIASIITFFLIPLCLTDNRKNHWNYQVKKNSPINIFGIFSIYIIRIQIAVVYLHASTGKFIVEEWANGTALYYWFNHSFFGSVDFLLPFINYVLTSKWVISLCTYGILIFELLLFLGLTASIKYRKRILIAGLLFHFLIIFFHGIFSFFFSMAGSLILFLYPTYKHLNFKLCLKKIFSFRI